LRADLCTSNIAREALRRLDGRDGDSRRWCPLPSESLVSVGQGPSFLKKLTIIPLYAKSPRGTAAGFIGGGCMNEQSNPKIARRDILRLLAIGAAAAATTAPASVAAVKFPGTRKARYRVDSRDVQTFYRVNRYPDEARR
jgi:hypothetical protein